MCGIAGWIDWERDLTGERSVLEAMTGTLTSRGPDAAGFWLSPHAAVGHRRLVEYAWNIPWWMKKYGLREKGILRRAMEGTIIQGVLERRKNPYPKTHDPLYLAAVRDIIMEMLDDHTSPLVHLIDTKTE